MINCRFRAHQKIPNAIETRNVLNYLFYTYFCRGNEFDLQWNLYPFLLILNLLKMLKLL